MDVEYYRVFDTVYTLMRDLKESGLTRDTVEELFADVFSLSIEDLFESTEDEN